MEKDKKIRIKDAILSFIILLVLVFQTILILQNAGILEY